MSDTNYPNVSWPNYSAANVQQAAAKTNTDTLGKDDFLKLLITQLQNQDPMQPTDDKEFIAQMAQFTSVEQLMNISTQLNSMSASLGGVSGLIGKEATWMQDDSDNSSQYVIDGDTTEDGQYLTGVVDAIVMRSGVQYAKIGSNEVPLTEILQINDPSDNGNQDTNTDTGNGSPDPAGNTP